MSSIIKRYPCLLDPYAQEDPNCQSAPKTYCLGILGNVQFLLPQTFWNCAQCQYQNEMNYNYCIQCKAHFDTQKIPHKIFKQYAVPAPQASCSMSAVVELVVQFDSAAQKYEYYWNEAKHVGVRFDEQSGRCIEETVCQILKNEILPIKISMDEKEIVVEFRNADDDDTCFEIFGSVKKLPNNFRKSQRWSSSRSLFDFECHRGFTLYPEADATIRMCSKWNMMLNNRFKITRKDPVDANDKHKKLHNKLDLVDWDRVPLICYDIETCFVDGEIDVQTGQVKDHLLNPYMVSFTIEYYAGVDLRREEKCFYNTKPMGCHGAGHMSQRFYEKKDYTYLELDLPAMRHEQRDLTEYLYDKQLFTGDYRYCSPKQYVGPCCTEESRNFEQGFLWAIKEILDLACHYDYEDFIIVGFNNYKFDDILTHAYWRNCIDKCLSELNGIVVDEDEKQLVYEIFFNQVERNTRITYSNINISIRPEFRLNAKAHERITNSSFERIYITFKDVVNYCPNESLRSSCENYGVPSKTNLNIMVVNEIIEREKMLPTVIDYDVKYFESPIADDLFELEIVDSEFYAKYIDEDGMLKIRDLMVDYCLQDTRSTLELFKLITNNMKDILDAFFPQMPNKRHPHRFISLAQFSKYILDEMDVVHYESDWTMEEHRLVEGSMFAGRTDYGILGDYATSDKNIVDVDVKAMYPTAMMGMYPNSARSPMTLDDFEEQQEIIDECARLREQQFQAQLSVSDNCWYLGQIKTFFCYANIYPPADERLISWGPLGNRVNEVTRKLCPRQNNAVFLQYFNAAEKRRPMNSVQIKMLIFGGWTVDIVNVQDQHGFMWHDQDQPIFSGFMQKYADIKTNAAAAKTVKLLMNSIAGKLGQRGTDRIAKTRRKYTLLPSKRVSDTHTARQGKYRSRDKRFDRMVDFYDDTQMYTFNKTNTHYLASLIWSWSHFMFWNTCYKLNYYWINARVPVYDRPPILLYCDTDSIFIDRNACNLFPTAESLTQFFASGGEVGSWIPERHEYDIRWSCKFYERIIVLGKKLYWIGDHVSQAHFKGVRGTMLEEFADSDGYNQLVKKCEAHMMNLKCVDGIVDRDTAVRFKSSCLTRHRVDSSKFLLQNAHGCEWKAWNNRFVKRVLEKKTTVNFSQKYDRDLCRMFDTFIQVFSPRELPELDTTPPNTTFFSRTEEPDDDVHELDENELYDI